MTIYREANWQGLLAMHEAQSVYDALTPGSAIYLNTSKEFTQKTAPIAQAWQTAHDELLKRVRKAVAIGRLSIDPGAAPGERSQAFDKFQEANEACNPYRYLAEAAHRHFLDIA